ncbi:phage antirepressor [Staphylococcus pseudintermedius]|nr:phage antirepressor [Staphylococcus pseudintermedius]EGQ4230646.1 phage antirepressor [Staphylococcus pseudintermedius]EIS6269092.1 phage antirepressor KilAC domain-containing protein [Staphylococcus pseudintermedius]MDK3853599.1 phage antirepressor KilAC domain-containing protein [Staphylococcus pseudintermedius]
MQDLQTFNFKELPVRMVEIENEPYFVGKDIAEILGYARADNAIRNHVDNEDKLTHQLSASGQNRNMIIINESGLYSLIFDASKQSKNENIRETARKFKRWVTSEVLPAIRKHGIYATDNVIENTLNNPDYIINILTEYKKEREHNLLLQQQVGELKPKADYVDEILKSPGTMTITQIAADYGLSAQKLNKLLHKARIQRRVGKQWILYTDHMNKGYTKSETINIVRSDGTPDTQPQTKWTQKGRLKIHEILTDFGYEAEVVEI